jgi:hypothetical protein
MFRYVVLALFSALVAIPASAQSFRAPTAPSFAGTETAVAFQAQPITNPSTVEFTASTDHATVDNTVPILTRYELEIYVAPSGTTPVKTQDLGKPTPGAGNLISYTQMQTVTASLAPGQYFARIAAIGPGGVNKTGNSAPFAEAPRAPNASGAPVVR